MTYENHRANRYPAPCCQCEQRTKATCCVDRMSTDEYGIAEARPLCFCPNHCPICGPKKGEKS